MADEDNTMMEVEETDSSEKEKSPSAIKKYGMYAGIALVVIIAAWFVTLKVVKPMLAGGDETAEVANESDHADEPVEEHSSEDSGHGEESDASHGSSSDSHGEKSSHGSIKEAAESDIFMVEEIIVNPAGTGGTRFLSTSIGFELGTDEAKRLFKERNVIVRDALITILSSQSVPELSDFKQRQRLRKLIQLRIAKILKTDAIEAVYFTEFAMQ
jgi:flagellar FliL protein